jgi:hypothetical protein
MSLLGTPTKGTLCQRSYFVSHNALCECYAIMSHDENLLMTLLQEYFDDEIAMGYLGTPAFGEATWLYKQFLSSRKVFSLPRRF